MVQAEGQKQWELRMQVRCHKLLIRNGGNAALDIPRRTPRVVVAPQFSVIVEKSRGYRTG